MRGKNPHRAPLTHDGTMLEVKSVFPTLQGEGPYSGWPAVFVRLGGCNLACAFCDTDFEDFSEMVLPALLARVIELAADGAGNRLRPLVVITGGEPLRQNIVPLCEALLAEGFKVQIETNGTLWRPLPEGVELICSPKNTGTGYTSVRGDVLARVNAFKFIVSADHALHQSVAEVGQSAYGTPVYVQPMDEYEPTRNAANLKHAVQLAMAHGYRLSLQLHKLAGIE